MYVAIQLPTSSRRIIIQSMDPDVYPVIQCITNSYFPFSSLGDSFTRTPNDLILNINNYSILFDNKRNIGIYVTPDNLYRTLMRHIQNNLLINDGYGILHGSAVVHNNKSILFLGASGTGKTTLVSYLNYEESMPCIADDILVIDTTYNRVFSSRSCFHLRKSTLSLLPSLKDLRPQNYYSEIINRYILNYNNTNNNVSYPIDYIFILNRSNDLSSIPSIKVCNDIEEIIINAFCPYALKANILSANHIFSKNSIYELFYGKLDDCALILKNLDHFI